MGKKYLILLGVIILIFLLLSFVVIRLKPAFDKQMYITKVDGEGILRSDYEKELTRSKHFFTWAKQDVAKLTSLEGDILDRMIEMKIVSQYAWKNKITVSKKEIGDYFHALVGKKSETEQLAKIKEMYGMEKNDYLQKLSEELLREKVQKHLQKPLVPWLLEMKKTYPPEQLSK